MIIVFDAIDSYINNVPDWMDLTERGRARVSRVLIKAWATLKGKSYGQRERTLADKSTVGKLHCKICPKTNRPIISFHLKNGMCRMLNLDYAHLHDSAAVERTLPLGTDNEGLEEWDNSQESQESQECRTAAEVSEEELQRQMETEIPQSLFCRHWPVTEDQASSVSEAWNAFFSELGVTGASGYDKAKKYFLAWTKRCGHRFTVSDSNKKKYGCYRLFKCRSCGSRCVARFSLKEVDVGTPSVTIVAFAHLSG
jgi:hypothetical protein